MHFRAILFDCDGTLVDSEGIEMEVIAAIAAEHGAVLDVATTLPRLRGLRMAECVARIEVIGGVRMPGDFVPELRRRSALEFRRRLQPIDGARDVLAALTVPFCVVSNGPREKIELSLTVTGLRDLVADRIFSAYDIGSWKPHPGLFLHAAAALGVEPAKCAVVEDSAAGVEAGVAAGMHVYALGEAVAMHSPNARVRHISSLRALVAGA